MVATDLSGATVTFDQFRKSCCLPEFLATWCPPSAAKMPSLFRLQKELADYEVEFAFLSSEQPDAVRKFISRRQWEGPFHLVAGDVPECFRTGAIPATFIVDKTGSIELRHFGAAKRDDEGVVRFLQGLAVAPSD
jgi:thiol-disulfide isomerase/thioredoxin